MYPLIFINNSVKLLISNAQRDLLRCLYYMSFRWCCPLSKATYNHVTCIDTATGSNSGLSVLLKDTSTRSGIEPPTPWLKEGPATHWPTVAHSCFGPANQPTYIKLIITKIEEKQKMLKFKKRKLGLGLVFVHDDYLIKCHAHWWIN